MPPGFRLSTTCRTRTSPLTDASGACGCLVTRAAPALLSFHPSAHPGFYPAHGRPLDRSTGGLAKLVDYSYNSYMKMVKTANLKNNLSRHLAFVRSGGSVVVLDRNTPVARIIPFEPVAGDRPGRADGYWTDERLAALERRGVLARPATRTLGAWLRAARPVTLPSGSPSAVGLLLQTRRESVR